MLYFKECKKVLFSLTFFIYFIAVIAMYFTQFHSDCEEPLFAPQPGQENYEDALGEYNKFLSEDKITGAYARLFCDYMGIVLAVLPVFAAVSLTAVDKRSRMEQLAYARKISSAKLIFTRYFALVTVLIIPAAITAVMANFKVCGMYPDNSTDLSAIFRYSAVWLIPNIMTASAIGMLLTELTSSMLAILVQATWWFTSINAADGLTGNIEKFTLVVRHNSLYKLDAFINALNNFTFNRIFYTVMSIIAIALTAFIYEQKRRGIFNGYSFSFKISKH